MQGLHLAFGLLCAPLVPALLVSPLFGPVLGLIVLLVGALPIGTVLLASGG